MTVQDLWGIAPELALVLTAFVTLLSRRYTEEIALGGLIAGLAALAAVPHGSYFFATFEIDGFSLVFKALFLAVALLVALGSADRLRAERRKEYYALLLLAAVGMMGVASAADLIPLFISFELSSLATYTLVAYTKREERAVEAATKFFIIGAFSSAVALYGISLLYGIAGTTEIRALGAAAQEPGLDLALSAGMVLVLAGFGFKITVVPFHLWAPDAYEGAPTPVTALLATGSKKMGFAALLKIFLMGLMAIRLEWAPVLGALAVLTMTMGNLLALNQSSVKRMLAYSSIAQAGYILIAFPVATVYGVAGGLFHIITHSIMAAGAFFVVAAVGGREDFPAFQGLAKRQPFLALAMSVFLLSLAGIPPLAGFQSKFVLFSGAVSAGLDGEGWLIWLAVLGVLNSALSLYYYARVLKAMYFSELAPAFQSNPHAKPFTVASPLLLAIAVALALVVIIGLYPDPLLDILLQAAQSALQL